MPPTIRNSMYNFQQEHLLRTHSLIKAQTGNRTSAHARTSNPEMLFGPEKQASLKQRSKRHTSEAEKWKVFWGILFPNMTNIPSPYLDDENASCAEKDQFASFQEMQCMTLPEKVQKRLSEETSRLKYTDVDELIDMLPALMREVMMENGFNSRNDTRANTPITVSGSFSVTANSAIRGHSDLQATSTPQQPTTQDSTSDLMFPGDASQAESLGHPQGMHVDTSNDSAYFSAEMEARQQPLKYPMEDAEDYHSHQIPGMSSFDGPSVANNYSGYSHWSSGSLITSFMQPGPGHAGAQDRSPTDFAGGWANDETLGNEGEQIADLNFFDEFLHEQGTQTDYALSTSLQRTGPH
ncbi:Ser thr protein phosphatase family protein [Lasiodiplodia theobromae]|uniref:Ser thr protein phosphatase family protein n=1 Tax=Lasiodiplodia theobromae TaxID=45133 RepID=UPI0015C2EB75|nr:Ser thr protein phosphatase family protein [Lasiodiplodia theobromae]KAF4545574.1 Ser thr protein phosphatase family protein [Lasiodiplodia theobromae]